MKNDLMKNDLMKIESLFAAVSSFLSLIVNVQFFVVNAKNSKKVSSIFIARFAKKKNSIKMSVSKKTIKESRISTRVLTIYIIEHYRLYDFSNFTTVESMNEAFVSFAKYDNYHLYINSTLRNIKKILIADMRLNDLTISKILDSLSFRALNKT